MGNYIVDIEKAKQLAAPFIKDGAQVVFVLGNGNIYFEDGEAYKDSVRLNTVKFTVRKEDLVIKSPKK